ncbi:RND family efflux transporter, MFP subunit [Hydrobacter penzbergensis]|jgi:membrane fusion protein (multidrug efflux system)|uniref:RND family efflux transporter, MFP subunit n=1 Tax=Hydrobacter penzbergensis TaxID=1235997 RepID=A0A8X8IDL1_9BACT|nr:efflux RND transporter periplasmic adaptor subunit [Hydrobacter penzbergensis]MBN8717985.1 efflux RND transporter periplasmic adaptor subunit [Sediminibacterium magnilacihabitans]PQV61579.1 RND family efflux transporter MFP subunit [Sediminibacterium magnilacihabitans]SDW15412.1 RND family efflux transporter, MFP subunit [Hydrobacter penzbergensis]
MRLFYLLSLIAIVTFFQNCSEEKEKAKEAVTNKARPAIKLAVVLSDRPSFTVTLPGELKPYEEVNIYPKVKGFIKKLYVDRGSYVRKGQLLAQLEAPEIGAQYAAKTSTTSSTYQKFLFSKQSYQRLKEAAKKNGAVATIELERAYAQYLGDSAAYHSSRSEAAASGQIQRYLRITAPFNGVITGRFVSEGALVGENGMSGQPLFQLTQESKLRLLVAIPEKQAQSLAAGTKATFTLIDYPGKTFTATLSRNSGALDPQTKSLLAEFDIDNANSLLRSGQYAKVTVQLQRPQSTLWAPVSSVVQSQAGVFVVKNENNQAKRIPVTIGITKDTLIEVFGNLSPGDQILLKGSEEIKEGTKIGQK